MVVKLWLSTGNGKYEHLMCEFSLNSATTKLNEDSPT